LPLSESVWLACPVSGTATATGVAACSKAGSKAAARTRSAGSTERWRDKIFPLPGVSARRVRRIPIP
jgi:hypothetical protein